MKKAATVLESVYEVPFQAHGCPEPMNCTAHVREDGCDVWVPTQNQGGTQEIASAITGLDLDRVKVHTTFLGGGFGRRGDVDFAVEAVELSKALKAPGESRVDARRRHTPRSFPACLIPCAQGRSQ